MISARLRSSPGQGLYLLLVCGALACVAAIIVFLAGFSMELLVGARKYVQGEGLWSNGQKEAVIRLQRYAISGSEADFQLYLESLRVPSAFHDIRVELGKREHDPAVLRRALPIVGLPTENWVRMVRRYRIFGHEPHIARAMSSWVQADRNLDELERLGDRLHAQGAATPRDEAAIQETLAEIYLANDRLGSGEVFSCSACSTRPAGCTGF